MPSSGRRTRTTGYLMSKRYYVKAETAKGVVVAYGVYDRVNGMESEHHRFKIEKGQSFEVALNLANACRDDMNLADQSRSGEK